MNEDAIMMMLQQAMGPKAAGPQGGGLSGINLQDPMAQPPIQSQIDPNTGLPVEMPIQQPPMGPSMQQQLQAVGDRLRPNLPGGIELDPLNPEQLVQGRWRF